MENKFKSAAKKIFIGCANCSTASKIALLSMPICVGFGAAWAEKDGIIIYDGEFDYQNGNNPKTVNDIELIARKCPNHDWRIIKHGPMHGETFQRQGENNWVCIESNNGFA